MNHGEAPPFLMWCGPLLFMFGMAWAWLVTAAVAKTGMSLDLPVRSALLIGAGMFGTVSGQFGVFWAWRRSVRATTRDEVPPLAHSAAQAGRTPDEPSHEVAKKRIDERV